MAGTTLANVNNFSNTVEIIVSQTNNPTALNTLNNITQMAAITTSLTSLTNPVSAAYAINAGGSAMAVSIANLGADISASNVAPLTKLQNVVGDALSIFSDGSLVIGAIAAGSGLPAGEVAAEVADTAGAAAGLAGLGIKNFGAIVTNTPIALHELATEVNDNIDSIQATGQAIAPTFISNNSSSAFTSVEQSLYNGLTSVAKMLQYEQTNPNLTNTDLTTQLNNLYSAAQTIQSNLASLYNAGGVVAANIITNITNSNSFTVQNAANNSQIASGTANFSSNGNSTGIATTDNNGNPVNNSLLNFASDGSISQSTQNYNPDGTVRYIQYKITDINGQTSYDTKYYDSSSGNVAGDWSINPDGSSQLKQFGSDGVTQLFKDSFNKSGNVQNESWVSNITISQFSQVAATALATQVIAQFVFKNNLPASALAQAFANVAVNRVSNLISQDKNTQANFNNLNSSQQFVASYGIALADIAADIGGSVLGAKLFQELGLPSTAGSVIGGAVTSYQINQILQVAKDTTISTTSTTTAGGTVANPANYSFATSLASAGGAAIGSYLGLDAAKLTIGDLNNGATFGGAVGGAVGGYFGFGVGTSSAATALAADTAAETLLGSIVLPGLGSLVGTAIGSYLGSLFGSLFGGGSSVGPNADASIAYNGSQWYLLASNADNGGNLSIAQQLAQATIGELNGIASGIGGHLVVNQPGFGVGYFAKYGYYANYQINGQNNFTYSNSTQTTVDNAVIAAVHREVTSGGIQGGNPFMEYAYAHSSATTAAGLISDLNAAHDYGLYLANPLAFDASLALTNSQTQINTWQQEVNQAQALGLGTAPSTSDLNAGVLSETGSYVASHLEILNDFYTSNLISSITLTDNTLTIGANQLSQYNNLLSTISQNNRNSITISDTNANISANIATINAYITGNLIAAVNTTDSTSSFINSTALTLAANSVQTITGRGNTINLSTGDSLTLNTIGTGGNVVNGGNGDTVYFYGNVSQTAGAVIDRVNMNNGVLEAGKNACLNLYGYGNTIIENDNVTLSVFGNNNGIQGADGQTIYNDFSGGYNITVGNNSTINITGNGFTGNNGGVDNLTLFGGHVNVLPTFSNVVGADININGSNNVITLYSKDNVIVTGGNNTINSNGLGNSVTVSGNGSNGGNAGVDTINMFNVAVNVVASASAIVNGYGNTITEATGDTVTFNSSGGNGGSNLYISAGATLNFSGNAALLSNGIIDNINASGDIVNAANGSCYNLFGSNNTTNNGNNVTLTEFGNNDGINGGTGNTVYTDFGGGYNIAEGTGSKIIVAGNGQAGTNGGVDNLYLSSGTVNFVASSSKIIGANASVTGSNNTINMIASDTLSLNGNANIINAVSGDAIILAANSQVTINGSGLTITAAAGDNITLNGTAGSNHIIGSGAYTLTLNGASKGTGNNYGTFGFAGNKEVVQNYINSNATGNPALQEVQAVIASGSSGEILEGTKWGKEIVTWSMDNNMQQSSVFQKDIQGAFNAWSKVTGIDFVEVTSSNKADITFDFSNFDSLSSGVVGYTNYSSNNGIFTSANINLENPNQDSLINTAKGLTYSGTNATFEQVVEHEIGHAIGFADNNNPNSIMDYYLGSQNQTLSSSDIAAASSLYPQTEAAIGFNSHYLNLIQDIGSLGFNQSSSSSLLGSGNPFPNNNVIASSSQIHHI